MELRNIRSNFVSCVLCFLIFSSHGCGVVVFNDTQVDRLTAFDHGNLPKEDIPAVLVRDGEFCLWKPIGPPPLQHKGHYISVRHKGKVEHFPMHIAKKQYYLNKNNKFNTVDELAQHYSSPGKFPNPKDPSCLMKIPKESCVFRLKIEKQIGQGQFGTVNKGLMIVGNQKTPVAIKQCRASVSAAERDEFLKEARIMRGYSHKNIVKLYGVSFPQPDQAIIIMELVNGGALKDYLQKNEGFTSVQTLYNFCKDCVRGMAYLESQKCLHRDLAARNCLVDHDTMVVKISDFGLSQLGEKHVSTKPEKFPWRWSAPEVIEQNITLAKSDVWSYAVLMWEIFSEGHRPYQNINNQFDLMKFLRDGQRLAKPRPMPKLLYQQMKDCMQIDPELRPTFALLCADMETMKVKCLEQGEEEEEEKEKEKA